MVKAIARAFRWRGMIEAGAYATIREIAAAENISETYVGRTLRLTLLAPSLVEAIQDHDYLVVQSTILVFATIFLVVNLLVDITYAFLNPRIRYS